MPAVIPDFESWNGFVYRGRGDSYAAADKYRARLENSALNAPSRNQNENNIAVGRSFREALGRRPRLVWPALAVLGVGTQGSALELGDIAVQSSLGEPLRASIAVALNPREEIASYCIYVRPGRPGSGLPSVTQASVAVSNGAIHLRGQAPLDEPLLALQLAVDCPYAAHLRRDYVVFVDPRAPFDARAGAETPAPAVGPTPRREVSANARPVAAHPVNRAPIAASVSYRVQSGETLSGIAQRISGRTVGIWEAVDLLFAANPAAFVGNDPDRLKAGALLRIPDTLHAADGGSIGAPPVGAGASSADAPRSGTATAYNGYGSGMPGERAARAEESQAAGTAATAPRPGDVSIGAGGPFVSPIRAAGSTEGNPANDAADSSAGDASEFAPAAEELSGTVVAMPATARAPTDARGTAASPGAWPWLVWLGGSGVALILGLLLFGRPLKRRFGRGSEGVFDERQEGRRKHDMPATNELSVEYRAETVDFRFDDAGPDARIVNLDGDLDAGTGFQESGDIDVAQDFGFSTSSDIRLGLDVEFPDEAAAGVAEGTDMLPPFRPREDSILESEIPPRAEESGEYDVSMIVDATMQPIADNDETAKDLKAVELDAGDDGSEEDPYTLSGEVDYKILEQDYQDELTATQALNMELSRAARELLGNRDDGLDSTAEMPRSRAAATGVDATVEMPVRSDDAMDDSEDTNVNEEIHVRPAENDATVEMEMDVEPANIDAKKLKAS